MAKAQNGLGINSGGQAFAFNTAQKALLACMLQNFSGAVVLEAPYRQAGTLRDFRAYVSANTIATSASSFSACKNGGGVQNNVVSIGAGLTGWFTDTTHSDTVSSGDTWGVAEQTPNTSGSLTLNVLQWTYDVSGAYVLRLGGRSYSTNSGTIFGPMTGGITSTTEADRQGKISAASTLSNSWVSVSTNPTGATNTIRPRVNGANVNSTVPVGSGITGIVEDTTHSDTLAVDDLVCFTHVYGGSGFFVTNGYGADLSTTSVQVIAAAQRTNTSLTQGTTYYLEPISGVFAETTEARHQNKFSVAGDLAYVSAHVTANGVSASSTLRSRLNGADGNVSIAVASAGTGQFQDTSHSDTIVVDDLVAWSWAVGAGGTTLTVADVVAKLDPNPAATGHPTMRRWGGVPFMGGLGIGQKTGSAHSGSEWGRSGERIAA